MPPPFGLVTSPSTFVVCKIFFHGKSAPLSKIHRVLLAYTLLFSDSLFPNACKGVPTGHSLLSCMDSLDRPYFYAFSKVTRYRRRSCFRSLAPMTVALFDFDCFTNRPCPDPFSIQVALPIFDQTVLPH